MEGSQGARKAAGIDEVDAHGVRAGKAVGSGAVGVGFWLGEAGDEVGVTVGRAFTGLQRVCVRGEELQSKLNAAVMFAYFGYALERLVVRIDAELGGPEVTP